ncbi:MAG: SMC family ATPase [Thaumarchaeota archaeon]|nr:SMC family ATPase [Nitrososphaerota archaeon]MCY3976038.1 SMC family ATPase [Nitrososphaerota archaeon]
MIQAIELNNFLSHSFTKLKFDKGLTIFIGHNGSGKSSIIDAITFALFGKHVRKSNKSLIKKGCNQAYVKIQFSTNRKTYEAIRKIDRNGEMYSHLIEINENEELLLVSGERKQFGESMTKQIESILGMGFTKLKITSIVQQGELNAIIKSKPKEFKEIINSLIGINKLDIASSAMRIIKKKFRESVQNSNGYDDTHINILSKKKEDVNNIIKTITPLKKSLIDKKLLYDTYIQKIQTTIENETYKMTKFQELKSRKSELINYVNTFLTSTKERIYEKEQKLKICNEQLKQLNNKTKIEFDMKNNKRILGKIITKMNEFQYKENIFNEHMMLTKKLKLNNNQCPICYSTIKKLNPLFHEKYIKYEIYKINNVMNILHTKKLEYEKINRTNEMELQNIMKAEAILSAHSIRSYKDMNQMQEEYNTYQKNINKITHDLKSNKLFEMASIDFHTRDLCIKIRELEQQVQMFDFERFSVLKKEFKKKQSLLNEINQELGATISKLNNANKEINEINNLLLELNFVKKYINMIDTMHDKIFNREGVVATSLRSWVLNMISRKASDYLSLLNINVNRIEISEKTHEMSITCYSKNDVLEIDSLSGGEQVSIAIALRLSIMNMLGISNLNCVILDEPTMYLDEERRKSLVDIFSQLSETTKLKESMQLIIITHDSEIFENADIDTIYKFSKDSNGSNVTSF